MRPAPITEYVITPHAVFEMRRRRISEETVRDVMNAPEQRLPVRPGREVFQSKTLRERDAAAALVRVFVDVDRRPAEVVTVYRTSKVAKYWDTKYEG